ncbi:MAG: hypothetical protein ABI467_15535 [Kofleriaceae bacterium]
MRRLVLVLVVACGSSPDHATVDAPGQADAPAVLFDGSTTVPLAGFGDLSGACGVLAEMDLTSPSPQTFQVNFNFARAYMDPADRPLLTPGGQHMAATPNAGGSSGLSEIFAYEQLARCELAVFDKSETEIIYDPVTSKKTDLEVTIAGHKIGVSVTRAFKGPFGSGPLDMTAAVTLATKKFSDIHDSTAGVQTTADRWDKQILAVETDDADDAATFLAATATLDPSVIGDTILVLTTTDGDDGFIYTNL